MNVCRAAFPYFGAPRIAAGGPAAHDVLKCQLRPFNPLDYLAVAVPFTDDQLARLRAAFPNGVCDWTKPGVDQCLPLRGRRSRPARADSRSAPRRSRLPSKEPPPVWAGAPVSPPGHPPASAGTAQTAEAREDVTPRAR